MLEVREVHRRAGLYLDEVLDRAVLRILINLPNKLLDLLGISLKRAEGEEPVHQFYSQRIPQIVVHNQWESEVKKLDHRQMDAKMAFVSVTHTLVKSRRIPRHASLKRGQNLVDILRELFGVGAIQFPLDDRRDLPDLQRRQTQPNAI